MRFKILDEVDDTPARPYRMSLVERIRADLRDKQELEELLKSLEKKEKKEEKKKGLSQWQIFLILTCSFPIIAFVTTSIMRLAILGTRANLDAIFR